MKYYSLFILKVIVSIIVCIFYSSPASSAYDHFSANNIKLVNGGIQGELCSTSSSYFNEVIVTVTALDRDGVEIWYEAIPIDGIGSKQCKAFFKTVTDFEKPFKMNFEYLATPEENIFNIHNIGNSIYFHKLDVNGREISGTVCSGSTGIVEDILVSVLGIKRDRTVLWRKDSIINKLFPKDCQNIAMHIDTVLLESSFFYLMSMTQLYKNANIESGKINDELSYKEIVVRRDRFKGKICNDSNETFSNVLIRFFAMSKNNNLLWRELISVNRINPGQCEYFFERANRKKDPSSWKFDVIARN